MTNQTTWVKVWLNGGVAKATFKQENDMNVLKGNIIQLKPEYQDPGDENYTFVATSDMEKGRVTVICYSVPGDPCFAYALGSPSFHPQYVITEDMIETVTA